MSSDSTSELGAVAAKGSAVATRHWGAVPSRVRTPGMRPLVATALVAAIGSMSAAFGGAASQPRVPSAAPPIDRAQLPEELAGLDDEAVQRIARMSPLAPLAPDPTNRVADDERAASLGHRLFFETRISPKGISCATCHDPARHFTDGRPLAQGVGTARRNAPTVVDAARRRWVGWDGKFDSLWSQALAPIEHPDEMGSSRAALVALVEGDALYRAEYEAIFGGLAQEPDRDRVAANLLKSLGAYQRRLLSGEAPIDRFVAGLKGEAGGDLEALSPSARRGLATFVSRGGCYQCHRGASFTDEEFHALGLVGANGRVPDDPARLAALDFVQANPFNAAGRFSDAPGSTKGQMVRALKRSPELFGQFRTPPLRGVASTAPYMHDGRFATLAEVVRFYDTLEGSAPVGHHGESVLEPLGLGEEGRADLEAFLRALTPAAPSARWSEPGAATQRAGQPEAR
jgi:cytochrome c peroxidase